MNFGSLFSGIGGLDLGLERAGMTCLWQSEIDPYGTRVLAKHWPAIPNLGDIRDIDWRTVPTVDLVCGGYPCQPFSLAGVRRGENDERHLWPMFAECLRVVRPRFALLENVAGHLSLGFGQVLADLASIGYDARWDCIPAAAVSAPHIRDRVFVIATRRTSMDTNQNGESSIAEHEQTRTWPSPMVNPDQAGSRTSLGTTRGTQQRSGQSGQPRQPMECRLSERGQIHGWRPVNPAWATEPSVGRMADGIPNRMDRLAGLGNAVVPQVGEHIGNIIMDMAS